MRELVETLPSNALLEAFPHDIRARIRAQGRRVTLTAGQVLFSPGDPTEHIHFPERSLVSLIKTMEDGEGVEIALVGRDGMLGVAALMGQPHAFEAVVEAPGTAWRVEARVIAEEMATSAALRAIVFGYTLWTLDQVAQIAACNRLHSVEQRCRRWIVAAGDMTGDVVPVTHDTLARLLAVRRPGVTTILGALQKAGLLVQARGHITILDRNAIAAGACECANRTRHGFERRLSWAARFAPHLALMATVANLFSLAA